MSIWTARLPGGMPVWSEKLMPQAITRSDFRTSIRAWGVPSSPCTPATHSLSSGRIPFPRRVVTIGAWIFVARSRTAPAACRAPNPATMTGRWAPSIASTTARTASSVGATQVEGRQVSRSQ
ncbi:hypothetical protein DSECCO2_412640 [anaerobic digester metagenome]